MDLLLTFPSVPLVGAGGGIEAAALSILHMLTHLIATLIL